MIANKLLHFIVQFTNLINNDNETILNELNYLNSTLDITQLELINKTSTSVIIKAKNDSDKYFGEKKIYYMINNEQDKIINFVNCKTN